MTHNNTKRSRDTVVPCRHILLTGSTGVLGANLLKELLRDTDAEISCIIRAEGSETARTRLHEFLRIYDPHGMLDEAFRRRVHVIPGDVGLEHLGVSEETYARLVATIDVTIHVAALTNLFLNYRRIAPVNLGGTTNIIEFALSTKSRYLCHVSTHTVVGDKVFQRDLVFRESDLDVGQGFEHMSYQKTKFEAEKLVRASSARGLKWNIFRPGQIFGEAVTGRYPHQQGTVSGLFYDIFKTVTESGVAQDSDVHFDVVPVDYVSRGLVHLGLRRDKCSETYHLTNPDIKTYREVIGVLERLGFSIEWVDQREYARRLAQKSLRHHGKEYKSPTTSAFRWWYKRGIFLTESGITDCTFTQKLLEADGIHCPRIDERLLGTYFRAGTESGYFSATVPTDVGATESAEANA